MKGKEEAEVVKRRRNEKFRRKEEASFCGVTDTLGRKECIHGQKTIHIVQDTCPVKREIWCGGKSSFSDITVPVYTGNTGSAG